MIQSLAALVTSLSTKTLSYGDGDGGGKGRNGGGDENGTTQTLGTHKCTN